MRTAEIVDWNNRHAGFMLMLSAVVLFTEQIAWLLVGAGFSMARYLWSARRLLKTRRYNIGLANALTLFRYTLVTAVAVFYRSDLSVMFAAILVFSLCLDGFDGYVARKFDESSQFGLYLDMETDAYTVCIISVLLWKYHDLSALLLLAGVLRYVYTLLVRIFIGEQRFEPKRTYASIIAVLFYLGMSFCLAVTNSVTIVLVYGLTVLLVASFSRSFWFQWQAG